MHCRYRVPGQKLEREERERRKEERERGSLRRRGDRVKKRQDEPLVLTGRSGVLLVDRTVFGRVSQEFSDCGLATLSKRLST